MSARAKKMLSLVLCGLFGHVPGHCTYLKNAGMPYATANRPCRYCGRDDWRPYVGDWQRSRA